MQFNGDELQITRKQGMVFEFGQRAGGDPQEAGKIAIVAAATALGDIRRYRSSSATDLRHESIPLGSRKRMAVHAQRQLVRLVPHLKLAEILHG